MILASAFIQIRIGIQVATSEVFPNRSYHGHQNDAPKEECFETFFSFDFDKLIMNDEHVANRCNDEGVKDDDVPCKVFNEEEDITKFIPQNFVQRMDPVCGSDEQHFSWPVNHLDIKEELENLFASSLFFFCHSQSLNLQKLSN